MRRALRRPLIESLGKLFFVLRHNDYGFNGYFTFALSFILRYWVAENLSNKFFKAIVNKNPKSLQAFSALAERRF
jgi:hypothetical protein